MLIAINWVIAGDLLSLIAGIAAGVALIKPRHYPHPHHY
jgi:hypothetical protein